MALNSAEQPSTTWIDRWLMGLVTNRNLLVTPVQIMGMHIIPRYDALSGGLNMDLTPRHTLQRRWGFSQVQEMGAGQLLQNAYNWLYSGGQQVVTDLGANVYFYDAGAWNEWFSKSGGSGEAFFVGVGQSIYCADGVDNQKISISNMNNRTWGIAAPTLAPTITPVGGGSLSPTVGYQYTYCYVDSVDGHYSSAAPLSASTGVYSGDNFTIQGPYCSNPRCNQIAIFRTADGGSTCFFVATLANPGSGNFSYTDSTPDASLNTFEVAPINGINNPPPTGLTNICSYMGLIFGSVDNVLYVNAGGNTTIGVPEECWPPSYTWTFPGNITGIIPSPWGLLIATANNIYVMYGINMSSFYPTVWLGNIGISNANCWDLDFQTLYLYTSTSQLLSIGASYDEPGLKIADLLLSTFNPTTTSLSIHRSGPDKGLFISCNGNMMRYDLDMQGWSTLWTVPNAGYIKSVTPTVGTRVLWLGQTSTGGSIMYRAYGSTNQDLGSSFSCYATVGGLILAQSNQLAPSNSVTFQCDNDTPTSVSILFNEIDNGTQTYVPLTGVPDPPEIPARNTFLSDRYDFNTAGSFAPQQIQSIFVKIVFGSVNAASEIMSMGIV